MGLLTELSLFSGAGGGLLATKHLLGWQTICYVEWNKYAIEILKSRIRDGYLDNAPIWDDAFTFDGRPWAGLVDVVTAGFPCQPFSNAGKGLAENDPRNGWPAVIRILREVQPRYALLENVAGLLSKPYFRRILGDLAEAGFDIEHDLISAEEIGANHERKRLWIVAHSTSGTFDMAKQSWEAVLDPARYGTPQQMAHSNCAGCQEFNTEPEPERFSCGRCNQIPNTYNATPTRQREYGGEVYARAETEGSHLGSTPLSDSDSQWMGERRSSQPSRQDGYTGERKAQTDIGAWWAIEPELGRVADGVAHRVDRLTAIGNGQVPAVVAAAWKRLAHEH